MTWLADDTYQTYFVTHTPDGEATNADSTPVATVARNGTDDGTITPTVTNVAAGVYKVSFTIPAGWSDGDLVCVRVAATVDGTDAVGILETFTLDTQRLGELSTFDASSDKVTPIDAGGDTYADGMADILTALPDLSTFDASTDKVTPIDVDGVTFANGFAALLAAVLGVTDVDGTTVEYMAQDGTTTKLTITYDANITGHRLTSEIA